MSFDDFNRLLDQCGFLHDTVRMAVGSVAWERTYKVSESDDHAWHVLRLEYPAEGDMNHDLQDRMWMFAAKWAHFAFPKIVTSHKYAAALMCTKVNRDAVDDVTTPWPTFVVAIPDGMLSVDGQQLNRIAINSLVIAGQSTSHICLYDGSRRTGLGVFFERTADNMASLLFDGDDAVSGVEHQEQIERCIALAKRLVAGLLVAMTCRDNFRERTEKNKGPWFPRNGPPNHRVVFVGRPLAIDCRPEIRNYVDRGGRGPASVQTLVCGHYKRQVIGIGRTGRKVIWVEPYWRGPEDAPILSRPRLVGAKDPAA